MYVLYVCIGITWVRMQLCTCIAIGEDTFWQCNLSKLAKVGLPYQDNLTVGVTPATRSTTPDPAGVVPTTNELE